MRGWKLTLCWSFSRQKFIIHNLIPLGNKVSHGPATINVSKMLSRSLMFQLHKCMPSFVDYESAENNAYRWRYQWIEHGRFSKLTPEKYFEKAVKLFKMIPDMEGMGLEFGVKRQVNEWEAIVASKCKRPRLSINGGSIKEVQFCFNMLDKMIDHPKVQNTIQGIEVEMKRKRKYRYPAKQGSILLRGQ